jgi:hypothetical protein
VTDAAQIEKWADRPTLLARNIKETGDLHEGILFCTFIADLKNKSDSALDIVLPSMEEVFEENPPEEYRGLSFVEAIHRATGLAVETIKNHTIVGRTREIVPQEILPVFDNMNFKAKIQIADAVENGYDFGANVADRATGEIKSGWKAIADAYYPQEVALTLHDIKGTQPRNQFCKFEVDGDQIVAVTSIGRLPIAQFIDYDNPEVEEKVEWARGKMLRKLDILQRRKS